MSETTTAENTKISKAEQPSFVWLDNLQWAPASVLLLAASLTAHQLSTSPYTANLVLESRLLTSVLIAAEIVLAFWLISRFQPKAARWAAITTFGIFCVAALYKIVSGDKSCGCFGVLEVPPMVTLGVDIVMTIVLVAWPARHVVSRLPAAWFATGLLALGASLFPVLTFTTSSLSDVGQVVGDGDLVVIDTSAWEKKRLPITSFIEGAPAYMNGDWKIILYHEDCPTCQRLIQESIAGRIEAATVFVEVPPYKSPVRADRKNLLWRKLSDKHE